MTVDTLRSHAAGEDTAAVSDVAVALLVFHVPDELGICAGCLEQWARIVAHPCESCLWAHMVLDARGDFIEGATKAPDAAEAMGVSLPVRPGEWTSAVNSDLAWAPVVGQCPLCRSW